MPDFMNAPGGVPTAHADTYIRDLLPPRGQWPEMIYSGLPELASYPDRINAAAVLLDDGIAQGFGPRPALHLGHATWSYAELRAHAGRIARVLSEDMGLRPGERVLLRGPNNPGMAACWFAVLLAGGVAVATMPLLRAKELSFMIEKAKIRHALCDAALAEEMEKAGTTAPLENLMMFSKLLDGSQGLDRAAAVKLPDFRAVDTAADDVAVVAFTSGTTGEPKGTVHFHRDLIAATDCFSRHTLPISPDDVFTGSPPLAFTFGLGAFVLFPLRFGASTALIEMPSPDAILEAIERHRATGLYTAPTMYRVLTPQVKDRDISSLKKCVSAGEHLPKATWEAWFEATGIRIIDGIGSTEMLHIFISAPAAEQRPGSTGRAIPGYVAAILDDEGRVVPPPAEGMLAVKGPTGCRYLDNEQRQLAYVLNGWNLTGDVYRQDAEGWFWFVARGDDMIISAGYNISGPEVEGCLLEHPKVLECAVVAAPDAERGNIVKAFVVLNEPRDATPATVKELQDFVKASIAPYKYPRAVEFVDQLPKTQTGKLQRFVLRERETKGKQ